jgi:hypothetical protein
MMVGSDNRNHMGTDRHADKDIGFVIVATLRMMMSVAIAS